MGFRSYPRVYFELLLVDIILSMGMGLSSAFLSIFAKELDPSGILAGFVVSAWYLSRIFLELPSCIISDQIGRSRLLVLGLVMGACGAFLCALSNSVYILILGRAIWGLGAALYFMNNTALIIDLFDPSIRGQALGIFQGIELVGPFISAPIGAFMAVGLGSYNIVFYAATGLILCSFLLAFTSKYLRQMGKSRNPGPSLPAKEVFSELKNWSVAVVCVNSFSRMFIMHGIFHTVFSLYLNQEVKLDVGLIGIIMSARTAGLVIATLTSGYLSDKIGQRPIIIMGMLIEGVSLYAYTVISKFEFFLLVGLFGGFGEGMVWTSLIVLLCEVVPSRVRSGAIGLYRTFMDFGGLVGPVLLMLAFDNVGATSPFFFALAIIALNVLLLATVFKFKATA